MKRCLSALVLLAGHATVATAANEWTTPQAPFRIHGDTYYVGTRGLSAILLASGAGHVLIDVPMQENLALVEANIRSLGFRVEDIRLILNTHPHFDHAGGIAGLAADSGAIVRASPAAARALRAGGRDRDDPQYGSAGAFAAVPALGTFGDGETLRVGALALTAHATPGHTPGSTTWTWSSCEGEACVELVYADSLTAISNDAYRYGDPTHPERLARFRRGLALVASLPCDILITPHPEASGFWDRLQRREAGSADALIDRDACRRYAGIAATRLDERIAAEQPR